MNINDKSPKQKWNEALEGKLYKVKKKDLPKTVSHLIKKESQETDGYWIMGVNYKGNEILIHCATKEECLQNLAILNGIIVE
jgi:hypothetical protein